MISLRKLFKQGGSGSGDHGHSGRPGQVGGSSKGGKSVKVMLGGDTDYANGSAEYTMPKYIYHVTTENSAKQLQKQGSPGGRKIYFTSNPNNMMFGDEEINERLGSGDLYVLKIDTNKLRLSAGWKFDPEWYPSSSNASEVIERLNSGNEDLYIYTSNSVAREAIESVSLFRKGK